MEKIFTVFFTVISAVIFSSCDKSEDGFRNKIISEITAEVTENYYEAPVQEEKAVNRIKVTVGDAEFSAVLCGNEASNAFSEMLPMTLNMKELNGNEKYFYLPQDLPAAPEYPEKINAGDIMLYGSNCAVIFYSTFDTSYSYTRLGYIEDADGLASVIGKGDAEVRFEKI